MMLNGWDNNTWWRSLTSSNASLALLVINGIRVNATSLRNAEEGNNGTKEFECEENPEDTAETNGALVHLVVALRPPVEADTRENGTELTNGSAETVSKTTDTRWENFTWNDEGGSIWSEVEEELSNDEESETRG